MDRYVMQFPRGMKEASLGWLAPRSPPFFFFFLHSFSFSLLLPPPPPPPLSLCWVHTSGRCFAEDKKEILRSVAYRRENSPATGNALLQQLKQKPVTQVSLKQMRNESSPVRHPLNSEAGTRHASNIICLTRNAAQLLSFNTEALVCSYSVSQRSTSFWPLE